MENVGLEGVENGAGKESVRDGGGEGEGEIASVSVGRTTRRADRE